MPSQAPADPIAPKGTWSEMERWFPKPWALPLLVAAIVLPTFAGFAFGGPQIGVAVGSACAATIVFLAARSRTQGPIAAGEPDLEDPVLVLSAVPIETPAIAGRVAILAESSASGGAGRPTIVLAPARGTTLRRWLSDVERARFDAQRSLALSLGSLAAAGCEAEGRVVDEDPRQAVEDAVAMHGVALVVFVVPPGELEEEVEEIRSRLDRPVHRIDTAEPTGSEPTRAIT
jgi:hypothetical protein